jgi:predicted RNA-binding Zn ribbon-like protein
MERAVNDRRAAAASEELAFRFVAGHRALDFLCTLGNRHLRPIERLREPADLDRWLGAAGLSVSQRASQLDLEDARQLREAVNGVTRATLAEHVPDERDLRLLNEWARRPPLAPQVEAGLEPCWVGEHPVPAALALVAREAVELLSSSERSLIRECAAAPQCSLLYLDRSRAHRRRWCEMEVCGSRAKMASYRRRRHTTPGLSS